MNLCWSKNITLIIFNYILNDGTEIADKEIHSEEKLYFIFYFTMFYSISRLYRILQSINDDSLCLQMELTDLYVYVPNTY